MRKYIIQVGEQRITLMADSFEVSGSAVVFYLDERQHAAFKLWDHIWEDEMVVVSNKHWS